MSIYKDTNNKWRVDVYVSDGFGNKKRVRRHGFLTKGEAKKEEIKLLNTVYKEKNTYLFKDVLDQFFIYKRSRVKASTYYSLLSMAKKFESFNNKDIERITLKDLINYQNNLLNKGRKISYINISCKNLIQIIRFSNKINGTNNKCYEHFEFLKNNEIKNVNFYTLDDFKLYSQSIDCIMFKTLFNVLFYCGVRIGEALALKWNDIDFNLKTLNINKTLPLTSTVKSHQTTLPKNKSSIRVVTIPDVALNLLKDLKTHDSIQPLFNSNWFVFGGYIPISRDRIKRRNVRYSKLAKLPRIRIHDFRHSHASLLINSGANAVLVAKRLGHSDIKTTLNTYSHMFKQEEDKVLNILNNL